jgi:hypothetical protein
MACRVKQSCDIAGAGLQVKTAERRLSFHSAGLTMAAGDLHRKHIKTTGRPWSRHLRVIVQAYPEEASSERLF